MHIIFQSVNLKDRLFERPRSRWKIILIKGKYDMSYFSTRTGVLFSEDADGHSGSLKKLIILVAEYLINFSKKAVYM
jgi:hypothetical protein